MNSNCNLDQRNKEIMLMVFNEEMSRKDIAKLYNLDNENSVYRIFRNTIRKLFREMDPMYWAIQDLPFDASNEFKVRIYNAFRRSTSSLDFSGIWSIEDIDRGRLKWYTGTWKADSKSHRLFLELLTLLDTDPNYESVCMEKAKSCTQDMIDQLMMGNQTKTKRKYIEYLELMRSELEKRGLLPYQIRSYIKK